MNEVIVVFNGGDEGVAGTRGGACTTMGVTLW